MDNVTAVSSCQSVTDLLPVLERILSPTAECELKTAEGDYTLILQEVLGRLLSLGCGLNGLIPQLRHIVRLADVYDSLCLLMNSLKSGSRLHSCDVVSLLEYHAVDVLPAFIASGINTDEGEESEDIVKILGSFPDRIAPYLLVDYRGVLSESKFFDHVCGAAFNGLQKMHAALKENRNVSLRFYGMLMGKFCLIGQEKVVVRSFLLPALRNGEKDFVWRRLTQTLFRHIPWRAHEPLIIELLSTLEDGQYLIFLIGYDISDPHLSRLLKRTVFFSKCFPPPKDVRIFQTLLQCLYALDKDRNTFKEVLGSLADAWASGYGQRFLAVEYEKSVTKALILAIGILGHCIPPDGLLRAVLSGIGKRLKSTDAWIRRSGMVVGEIVTQLAEPAASETALKFEYVDSEDTLYLKSLMDCVPVLSSGFSDVNYPTWKVTYAEDKTLEKAVPEVEEPVDNHPSEDVDSDDDLVPYASSLLQSFLKTKSALSVPHYLQDCYDGLINKEDPAKRKVCLKALPALLEKQKDVAESMVGNFLQVLLSIEMEGALADCASDRNDALIKIAIDHPKFVGTFYGKEVRANNYGLGIRLEMLQVIRTAASQLAHPVNGDILEVRAAEQSSTISPGNGKTRRFASATRISEGSRHRFLDFTRLYVLPLVSSENVPKTSVLLLQQEDAMLLSHLLQTLSLLIHCAEKLPETPVLCLRVIEFAWDFRDYTDPAVKQAVLVCLAVCVQGIPLDLTSSSQDFKFIDQLRDYLLDVKSFDPNSKCAELASQVKNVLDQTFSRKLLLCGGSEQAQIFSLDMNRRDVKSITLEDVKKIAFASSRVTF